MSKNKRNIRWGLLFTIALNGFIWCGILSYIIDSNVLNWVFNVFAVALGFTGAMAWDNYTSKKKKSNKGA